MRKSPTPRASRSLKEQGQAHAGPVRVASNAPSSSKVAVLGWSLFSIEALRAMGKDYVIVGDPSFEDYARFHHVPFIPCALETFDPLCAQQLAGQLEELGVTYTVPLYEPSVEWCGALNSALLGEPQLLEWSRLFRDKAMMKRRAQLSDIPVGVFSEAESAEDVVQFLDHVNTALLAHEPVKPVHIKAFDEAGCKGHYLIKSRKDVDDVPASAFPCLVESDLEGQEIACEVFVHDGQIVFMNISEYVHLGHSVFVPPSSKLEARREEIRAANQRLVDAFEVKNGLLHPEWFLADDGSIHFGEVAYRVPGGNAFELIERAYGFSPYQAQVLVMDPNVSHEEVRAFFPAEDDSLGHAGVLLVYPETTNETVSDVTVPEGLAIDPAYEGHDMVRPGFREVEKRDQFVNGTHWGAVYLFSDDPERIRRLCQKYESFPFYR